VSASPASASRRAHRLAWAFWHVLSRPADLVVLIRMAAWPLALPMLKRRLPLPALARLMWAQPRTGPRDLERERRTSALARRLYRFRIVARDDNCLERSLLTYRFLARLNANPQLVAGVRMGDEGVLGHVWVTVDGEPVGESADALEIFSPVVVFGAGGVPRRQVSALDGPPRDGL
jgi:hypothetical protein